MQKTLLIVLYLTLALGGCTYTTGPSKEYPLESEQIKAAVERMEADPKGVDRPVVVIDGWTMIGGGPTIRNQMIRLTGGTEEEIINHSYLLIFSTLESNASKIIDIVEERWPSDDPEWTTEVDVIGYSMGGVIGRVAAMPPRDEKKQRKRLKVKSLYTISAPHNGVGWWLGWIFIDEMSFKTSLYAGGYRQWLDEGISDCGYDLICYGQGNDWICGWNTAPKGWNPVRSTGTILFSHTTSYGNFRALADIAARRKKKLAWNPKTERFQNDDEANKMLRRTMYSGWKL